MTETMQSSPQNFVHLFLRDAPRFFVSYTNILEKRFPSAKGEFDEIKQRTINQLKNIYNHEQLEHWRKEGLEHTKAFIEWSSAAELKRQKQTLALLKESLYDALVVAEIEIAVERDLSYENVDELNLAVQVLHHSVIEEIRNKKIEEYYQSGHLEITSHFVIPVEGKPGDLLDISLKLSQYGDSYIPKYVPTRDPTTFSPINALVDEITIKTSDGQTLSWKKLRSAFFDCHYAQTEHHINRFSDEELAKDRQFLNSLTKQQLDAHVKGLIERQDPLPLQRFVDVLNWDAKKFRDPSEALANCIKKISKFKKELENLLNEQKVIIQKDKECISQYLTTPPSDWLGFSIPQPVLEVFQKHESFNGKGWAMISHLQGYNTFTAYSLNKFISKKIQLAGIPTLSLNQLEGMKQQYINSLDSLYREMITFQEVAAAKNFTPSLFFHIPLYFKTDKETIHLELKKISYIFGSYLIYTTHDVARSKAIAEETHRNFNKVLVLANQAMQILDQEDQRSKDPTKKNLFKRYKTTLKCLVEQSFQLDKQNQVTGLNTFIMTGNAGSIHPAVANVKYQSQCA